LYFRHIIIKHHRHKLERLHNLLSMSKCINYFFQFAP
jgi:hypothetical protein